jgi:hypothetical protein
MDKDLPLIMKFRMQCIHGCDHNRKLSLRVRSEGVLTAIQYAFNKGMIMLRMIHCAFIIDC